MMYYLGRVAPLHLSSRNLFSLRCDFHMAGFDRARFVIVPKCGKLIVHFLQFSREVAAQYHNTIFDHKSNISHEALYARFAWALMKIIEQSDFDSKCFNFNKPEENDDEGEEDGGDMSGTQKRKHDRGEEGDDGDDGDEDEDNEDIDNDTSGTYRSRGSAARRKRLDAPSLQPDSWLSDVLHKMAPGDSQSSLEADAREIEEDLRMAAHDHPFLGMCEVTVWRCINDFDSS